VYKPYLTPYIIIPFASIVNSKTSKIRTLFIVGNSILLVLLAFMLCLSLFYRATHNVLDFEISSNGKYVAVTEETDLGAIGGHTEVYVGRNINFGIFGYYFPRKLKYYGEDTGETPEIRFLNNDEIFIKYRKIKIKGNEYIDRF
jgi:hypothetical protein